MIVEIEGHGWWSWTSWSVEKSKNMVKKFFAFGDKSAVANFEARTENSSTGHAQKNKRSQLPALDFSTPLSFGSSESVRSVKDAATPAVNLQLGRRPRPLHALL